MNVADSEKLAGVLESAGYRAAEEVEDCDIVLVNTCVVRQNAEDRASGYVLTLRGLKEKNPNLKIALCGCFVTEPGRDVRKLFPHVDLFIEPNQSEKLAAFLRISGSPDIPVPDHRIPGSPPKDGITKHITIMTGCDNFCSYCIVPYVRGREYSRSIEEILSEIRALDATQCKEIMLLGQNVNSYKYGFANLLNTIHSRITRLPDNRIPTLQFMTSHPKDMSDEIIQTVLELPHVAKEFHLPLQSGDDEILQQMRRGYTVDYYRDRINKIRSLMPAARITTDILVGFPGESEAQFEKTLSFVKEIGFHAVNMFAYSARPQTAASQLPHQLPADVKHQRLQKLIAVVRKMVL